MLCQRCGTTFDETFRRTFCPHEEFADDPPPSAVRLFWWGHLAGQLACASEAVCVAGGALSVLGAQIRDRSPVHRLLSRALLWAW